jgi:hypothetical protein
MTLQAVVFLQADLDTIKKCLIWQATTTKMKRVLAYGNGSCLFICLRLALECIKLLSVYEQGDIERVASKGIIDGRDEDVLKSAEELRNNYIIKWYADFLDTEIPMFGAYDEASKSAWN